MLSLSRCGELAWVSGRLTGREIPGAAPEVQRSCRERFRPEAAIESQLDLFKLITVRQLPEVQRSCRERFRPEAAIESQLDRSFSTLSLLISGS